MKRFALCLGLAALVSSGALAAFGGTYQFQPIVYPGDTFTQTLGINNEGVIVGYHGMTLNQGFVTNVSNTASFAIENFPGSVQTQVIGINNLGNTVGFYIDSAGVTHGFAETSGVFTTVDFPGTTFNQLLGVNDNGEAAGYWQDSAGLFHPFTWVPGSFTSLDLGSVAVSAQATGVNNAGEVTGFYIDSAGINHGFLLISPTPGAGNSPVTAVTTLDFPGSTLTQALGLNNNGRVVGFFTAASGGLLNPTSTTHGFIYDVASGIYSQVDVPGALQPGGTLVNGINDLGQIVGFNLDPSGNGNTDGFVGTPATVCTAASPNTLDFGPVPLDTPSAPQVVTLTNCGSVPSTVIRVLLVPHDVFTKTDTCPVPPAKLPPQVSCTINVTFTPVTVGPKVGLAWVLETPHSQLIRLSGEGIQVGPPTSARQ